MLFATVTQAGNTDFTFTHRSFQTPGKTTSALSISNFHTAPPEFASIMGAKQDIHALYGLAYRSLKFNVEEVIIDIYLFSVQIQKWPPSQTRLQTAALVCVQIWHISIHIRLLSSSADSEPAKASLAFHIVLTKLDNVDFWRESIAIAMPTLVLWRNIDLPVLL